MSIITASKTAIRLNQGQALLHLAGMYPKLIDVILELVQNALDKDVQANRVWIVLNYKTRHLSVRDNGRGVSPARFNAALASVATPGRKGDGSLGQFGIGLISPLGKCRKFTFVSCPSPQKNGFQEWTFVTDRIVAQESDLTIPVRLRDDLVLSEHDRGRTKVEWRSEMQLFDIVSDEYTTKMDMDQLIGSILDRYGKTMHRNKVSISVAFFDREGLYTERSNITASGFTGRPLPEYVHGDADSGRTIVRLFVTDRTAKGLNGKVKVGVVGNDFVFPFTLFTRSVDGLLSSEVVDALSSGLFEGEILSEKAKLHPTRRAFEKDDQFVNFCIAIDEWFKQIGEKHLEELKQERQTQRLQELGLRSIGVIENLVKNSPALQAVIDRFKLGTIGSGHYEDVSKRGRQDQKSKSSQGRHAGDVVLGDQDRNDSPDAEKKKHRPFTVAGTNGQLRTLVKNSSFGLQFLHASMPGSPDLWKLDCEQGVLMFNIRHPLWTVCDEKSDSAVMKLQEHVAIQALTLHTMPENLRLPQRQAFDELTVSIVSWIIHGDSLRSVRAKAKAKGE